MRPDSPIIEPREATETSPLLAQSTAASPHSALTPNHVPSSQVGVTVPQNGHSKPTENEEDQSNGENRGHQFEGMPDVKEKLWYIVPAVGIGVRPSSSLLMPLCLDTFSDLLVSCRSDHHRILLRKDW